VASDDEALIPGGRWFQWHFDRWTLPPGATEIARTANSSQAFLLGRALALQFHPELDNNLLEAWLDVDRQGGEVASVGLTHDDLRWATREFEAEAARRILDLVRGFLSRVAHQPCPS
jgi:GMP synthase-like glutamine amidotransferase